MKYSKHFNTKNTPQNQPIPGLNQIANNAGGQAFQVTEKQQLERFLTLGSVGGTFYVNEQKLTVDNAKIIVDLIKKDGASVVATLIDFAVNSRAPKADPGIFVLALAYKAISKVCRTSTHLFTFCANIQLLRGWSRGLRSGVAQFYLSRMPEQIAYQLVKYRQRDGWTHKDVMRLAHPKSLFSNINNLFRYAVGKLEANETGSKLIATFEQAMNEKDSKKLAQLIGNNPDLTWEMLPTEMLNNKDVLLALLPNMPLTALLRNLNRFTAAGCFATALDNAATDLAITKLTDEDAIKKAGLHPVNVLNTLKVYSSGRGNLGKLTWQPQAAIVGALQDTFELSFKTIIPTGKNILLGVDVSGSMGMTGVNNMALTPKEVAAAITLAMLKSEKNIEVMFFTTHPINISDVHRKASYEQVLRALSVSGGTDCATPYRYALEKKLNVDAIVTLTDSETWHGGQHPVQAFEMYRKAINPNVKAVVVAMVANNCTLLPVEDVRSLNIAGFDSAVPKLITDFIKD
jgi:60 kDa SS-A/Ro ribonucleoprotein